MPTIPVEDQTVRYTIEDDYVIATADPFIAYFEDNGYWASVGVYCNTDWAGPGNDPNVTYPWLVWESVAFRILVHHEPFFSGGPDETWYGAAWPSDTDPDGTLAKYQDTDGYYHWTLDTKTVTSPFVINWDNLEALYGPDYTLTVDAVHKYWWRRDPSPVPTINATATETFSIVRPRPKPGTGPYIARGKPDIYLLTYERGSNVWVERNTRIDTLEWSSVITPFAGQQPCVAQDATGTPYVLYTDGTNVKRRNVLTGAEANMATGKRPFERWSPGWAFRVLTYWRVTGAGPNGVSYFMRYDASGAVMTAETALVSDVPEQAVSVDWQANGTLTALYSDGTNIHTLTSTDNGATWA